MLTMQGLVLSVGEGGNGRLGHGDTLSTDVPACVASLAGDSCAEFAVCCLPSLFTSLRPGPSVQSSNYIVSPHLRLRLLCASESQCPFSNIFMSPTLSLSMSDVLFYVCLRLCLYLSHSIHRTLYTET